MSRKFPFPLATLAALMTLATISESSVLSVRQVALAQSPPLSPAAVPAGTTVRIDGSPTMSAISQTLREKFEAQFPGAKVEFKDRETDQSLNAVQEGRADLAAIGRSLTAEEQAAGLVQTPVSRRKIAIVVGDRNPFPGDLTGEEFAQIFRGEITNWSQVRGPDKPIRVIDRVNSDTRAALRPYPVFQGAEFKTGQTGVEVRNDSVDAMIRRLGDDGISYALLDEVANKPGVKIISLYGTQPTDPRYPFSQPLTYVYKGPQPSSAVQSFLALVAADPQAAATAGAPQGAVTNLVPPAIPVVPAPAAVAPSPAAVSPAPASPAPAAVNPASPAPAAVNPASPAPTSPAPEAVAQAPAPTTDTATGQAGVPWWLWLLSIPLLGALLWTLFKGLDRSSEVAADSGAAAGAAASAIAASPEEARLVLTPRNSQDAYAYWEVSDSLKQRVRREEGGQKLALRLYDVTGLDFERHPAHSIQEYECQEFSQDMHIPVPESNRDYLAELGYVTYQGRWIKIAQSEPIHVPGEMGGATETEGFADFSAPESFPAPEANNPGSFTGSIATPGSPTFPKIGASFQEGGTPLVDPATYSQPPIPTERTDFGVDPLDLEPTQTSDLPPDDSTPGGFQVGAAAAAAAAAAAVTGGAAVADAASSQNRVKRSRIVLAPRNSHEVYVYWEVLDHHKEIAKQHGGEEYILRICDVTGVNLDQQAPHSIQQFNCDEADSDRHVTVPASGDYIAEIGYLANNGRWLRIARSAAVRVD